jgi:predicted metal-dependent phosphoesterase TrpH
VILVILRLDLHIHSVYSLDAFNTIETINNRLKENGLNGYALTDHDSLNGIQEAKDKSGDLVFIPGLEISAKGAHVLALDPIEAVKTNLSITETVDQIHDQGAIAILAHPYGFPRSWIRIKQVEEARFDAIEVANSAQIPYGLICELNQKLANKLRLPITGGSDSHMPETVGRSYTIIESDSNEPDDVIKAIRLGRTSAEGSCTRISEWLSRKFRKKSWM